MNLGCKPVSSTSTSGSGDGVSDQFPVGLRVLIVDDDATCLLILEKMLRNCKYEVTKCNQAEIALKLLREKKNGFDIVISDVHMPDMDGFKLLELIGLEILLPVIMMSADDTKNVVMKGITHGACDFLIKPVPMEALKNIWQHVVRKNKYELKEKDLEQSGSADDEEHLQKPMEDVDYSSTANEGHWKHSKRRKDDGDETEERDDRPTLKKPRVVWSTDLHQQFVVAVNQLGADKAVPKKILEIMNVPGLTRENVASHLQKYRLFLKRGNNLPNGLGNSYMGTPETAFAAVSSLNGLSQPLAASPQLPHQSVACIQTASFGRTATAPPISVNPVDERTIFGYRDPKIQYIEVSQQPNISVKQVNLLHGVPKNMDSKQLATLQQSAQLAFCNMNLHINSPSSQNKLLQTQMIRQQSRAQILNEINGAHVMNEPSVGQPVLSRTIPNAVLGRSDLHRAVYSSVSHPSTTIVDLSWSRRSELPRNSFSLLSNSGVSTLTSKGLLHEEVSSEMKPQSLLPNYDEYREQNHQSKQGFVMPNVGSTPEARQHPNPQVGVNVSPSIIGHPGFSSIQKSVQNKADFSVAEMTSNQQHNNDLSVKVDGLGNIHFFPENSETEEDLMTLCDKELQQEGMEDDYGIHDFESDELHV